MSPNTFDVAKSGYVAATFWLRCGSTRQPFEGQRSPDRRMFGPQVARVGALDHWLSTGTELPLQTAAVLHSQTFDDRYRRRIQLVNATVWLNRSAGVWKPRVFLGLSFNCLATALSLACE